MIARFAESTSPLRPARPFFVPLRNRSFGASDKSDVLLAQAFGEYVGLSAILASFQSAWLAAQDQITSVDKSTWVVVGLIAFLLLRLWNRR